MGDKARSIKNKFESGEFFKTNDDDMDNDGDGTNGQSNENHHNKRSNPVEMIVIEKGMFN